MRINTNNVCNECKCNIFYYDDSKGELFCGYCGLIIYERDKPPRAIEEMLNNCNGAFKI